MNDGSDTFGMYDVHMTIEVCGEESFRIDGWGIASYDLEV